MSLLRLQSAGLEFADQQILKDADLSIEKEERICLIGRNGAGKTTLLRVLNSTQDLDHGELHLAGNLRISVLQQDLPKDNKISVRDCVALGLEEQCQRIDDYESLSSNTVGEGDLQRMEALQEAIEVAGGWNIDQQIEATLSELALDGSKLLGELSGGWKRRVALAQALVSKPDLLMLDEPTNHLDINTIEWLEHRLLNFRGSVILISHDRSFVQKLATRVVEIDRGRVISWPGDLNNYLRLKEKADQEEDRHAALFDKRLAQEEGWIRQGIKARRTRNEGRVRALQSMRSERAARIKRQGRAKMQLEGAEPSGRKVIEARKISHGFGDEQLIKDFSVRIMRGDRIGVIGNNGVGKSTLLSILLGELEPQQGSVKIGSGIQVAYFDQLRADLDVDDSVMDFVAEGREFVEQNGKQRHIISYLQQFLFSPKRARTKISALSGGERNRVMLAKLFTRPSNMLVLDEPSNDLDVEMLEALEQCLIDYQGTVLLVSHDRALLDNVVTSTLVFEDHGMVQEYIGGYSDWQATHKRLAVAEQDALELPKSAPARQEVKPQSQAGSSKSRKLSFTERHELDALPGQIAELESQLAELQGQTLAADFYSGEQAQIKTILDKLTTTQSELDNLVQRWVELESMQE